MGDSDAITIIPAGEMPPEGYFPKAYDAAVMSVRMYDDLSKPK